MSSNKEAQRRQRRRELDVRRSKLRVRLGSWPESWSKLKEQLGFSLHSELAQFLLDRLCVQSPIKRQTSAWEDEGCHMLPPCYSHKVCSKCSGHEKDVSVSVASLDQLILLVHSHGQRCPLTPSPLLDPHRQEVKQRRLEEYPEPCMRLGEAGEAELCLTYVCEGGHEFTWRPIRTKQDGGGETSEQGRDVSSGQRKGEKREEVRGRRRSRGKSVSNGNAAGKKTDQPASGGNEEMVQQEQQDSSQEGQELLVVPPNLSAETETENVTDETQDTAIRDVVLDAIPKTATRGSERTEIAPEKGELRRKPNRLSPDRGEALHIYSRRKRKPAPRLILPCEFDGCWKIFSTRQYLNYHMKYQHIQQKTFTCSDPSCGKSFNFKKHLKEHEKLHSDQRDYICEFCARGFRTSSNLSIHRRIHTGEKPLQCEVCGFTCRQKASLNWHMRKHDAERSYRFPCEICGRRFEKKDSVATHQSKSHPDRVTSDLPKESTAHDL